LRFLRKVGFNLAAKYCSIQRLAASVGCVVMNW
jgi:hypothetical protein